MKPNEVFLLSAVRTPMGGYGGALASLSAIDLGSVATVEAVKRAAVSGADVDGIVMGNVLSANLGQAPARQVSRRAGLPDSVCATTVNKVCASGMKAVAMGFQDIALGAASVVLAGGMESMSNVPHYLPGVRFGVGYGDASVVDGLARDALVDVYDLMSMGVCGDKTAEHHGITRAEQDDFAEASYRRSAEAWNGGRFDAEIVTVDVPQKKGAPVVMSQDEEWKKANFEKMRQLKPAFTASGSVTAANASPMSDGAAALVLARGDSTTKPLARIVAYAEAEQEPTFFTTAPVLAAQRVLKRAGLSLSEIDVFEVNEAFAVVPLAFMRLLNVPHEKVNVFGGAVSLGHPLGASGARLLVTLTSVLCHHGGRYGLAAICNGGGGASAMIIERV